MNDKKHIAKIVALSVAFTLLFQIFFGRWLLAKISTLPLLNRFKIINPQSPIVIRTKEEVRVSDSGDVLFAVQEVKSKISSLVYVEKNSLSALGSAVNLTNEGTFLVSAEILKKAEPIGALRLILADGRIGEIKQIAKDPASGLAFLKTNLDSVSVAGLSSSNDLKAGEKLAVVSASPVFGQLRLDVGYVSQSQTDSFGEIFSSEEPSRSFGFLGNRLLSDGDIVVNLKGEVAGIFSGRIISSDVLKQTIALHFQNSAAFLRPKFGFEYKMLAAPESQLLKLPGGAQVTNVAVGSAAASSGLRAGDIIAKVQNEAVSPTSQLEEILEKFKPGEKIIFEIYRSGEKLEITIVPRDSSK